MLYHVTYQSNGLKVKGYLAIPFGYELPDAKPYELLACSLAAESKDVRLFNLPGFLYCRGGIGNFGRVKTEWIQEFAKYGHVVFAPSYRGNEGGEGRDEFGGKDKEDVLSAFRFLQSLPFVNSDRISVMGFSRGAINATQTAVELPEVHKLILWNGVSDLAQTYEERIDLRRMLKRVVGGSPATKPELYQSRSPLAMAGQIHCPVLLMHGTEDAQVPFRHGLHMYHRLKEHGVDVEMHRYEGYGHLFPPPVHEQAVQRMFEWIAFPVSFHSGSSR